MEEGGILPPFFIPQKMKKFWVLSSLFILPLVFYVFLSLGIYRYANLPILTEEVVNIDSFSKETFDEHLSIICFLGSDMEASKTSLFNLNQVVYKRYFEKPYFQMIAVYPEELENDLEEIKKEISNITDMKSWVFLKATETNIRLLHQSFETPFVLNNKLYSEHCYIIDMESRLRGRLDDEDSEDGKLYGYDMNSIAVLKNKLKEDIDIIYYQLKKSAEKEERRRKI